MPDSNASLVISKTFRTPTYRCFCSYIKQTFLENFSANNFPKPAIIYSKLTIETLEQGVKYVYMPLALLTLNIFYTLL